MSTTTSCRREEVATCQPDKTILVEQQLQTPPAATEQAEMSEKQFLRFHTLYSAMSSWLFAIAGATNIGVLCAFSSKILMAVEKGQPIFKKSTDPAIIPVMGNKKYNLIALGMIAFGGACMAISNYLESMKVVTEWQLGANKLCRRVAGAERKQKQMEPENTILADVPVAPAAPSQSKNWVASIPDPNDRSANRSS